MSCQVIVYFSASQEHVDKIVMSHILDCGIMFRSYILLIRNLAKTVVIFSNLNWCLPNVPFRNDVVITIHPSV